MALKADVEKILNKQIEKEFDAATVYQGVYIYFQKELLPGFAAWFKRQLGEERDHAAKIIEYALDRGGSPAIPATKAPKVSYGSPLEALKAALAHERANTAGIYACLETAQQAGDPATVEFLQWFVKEQVEEEATAEELLAKVAMIGDSKNGLFMMDRELGMRSFKLPTGVTI